ncbi:MAG TPA: phosphoribosyltransferase family protein [Kofleriaceae bacterium]|nr:phosphoribosyltransferase family protein [Kofleriaceae bacterium]
MNTHAMHEQGLRLATAMAALRDEHPLVLAIPRSGVPVADTIARQLGAPLDVVLARKLLSPDGRPLAGVADGAVIVDDAAVSASRLSPELMTRLAEAERLRILTLLERIRDGWPAPPVSGRTVIVVDDAVITGLTMRAAIAATRARGARRVVVATPLCAADTAQLVLASAHDLFSLELVSATAAARLHGDPRRKLCPPLGDAEIHDLIAAELLDVEAEPFQGLVLDGA